MDTAPEQLHIPLNEARAERYRQGSREFAHWATGQGVVSHDVETQVRVFELAEELVLRGLARSREEVFKMFAAADCLANTAKWLVVHMTYAKQVYLDGRTLNADDFKSDPQGHTGGSLNMVPAYVGYMLANALSGKTRSWLMGQGHCVAAVDAVNLILDNMEDAHRSRYSLSDEGLTRFVNDFYSCKVRPDGLPESPLGSHVNAHTGGATMEGGYLGFAELYYVHMPLPDEELVAFLSDGAFEEQRGSDWTPRWWRPDDCGNPIPIMIANGRRIDQRTTMAQEGGVEWFRKHLELNQFTPIDIDGRDPAAFAWAILHVSEIYEAWRRANEKQACQYPCHLPYVVAETIKGYGFVGAGTNAAHNLPLQGNPAIDEQARSSFNEGVQKLWQSAEDISESISLLRNHQNTGRVAERKHSLARRRTESIIVPNPKWHDPSEGQSAIAMNAIDDFFCQMVEANPHLRPRIGNPDELRSNKMGRSLDLLKHRVCAPEEGIAEALTGNVITALNEEAVVCAALANKGGINIAVSYEAFAVKMLGAIRQEIIFARNQLLAGKKPAWLSIPIVLSSHVWENGKNEQSHQDPTLSEALMSEMSDVSHVLFPADWNSAAAALKRVYETRGEIWTLVVAKRPMTDIFSESQAEELVRNGAIRVCGSEDPELLLVACGAYQLEEALKAYNRLSERSVNTALVYLQEPGRYREPRDRHECLALASQAERAALFPESCSARVFFCHGRPESFLGVVRTIDTGAQKTRAVGYINRGGTFGVNEMLYANRATWAHGLLEASRALGVNPQEFLSKAETTAVYGEGNPNVLWQSED